MNKFRARVFGRSFGKIFGDLVAISGIIVYNNYLRSAVRVAAALRDRDRRVRIRIRIRRLSSGTDVHVRKRMHCARVRRPWSAPSAAGAAGDWADVQ